MRWLRGGSTCLYYYAPQEHAVRCGRKSTGEGGAKPAWSCKGSVDGEPDAGTYDPASSNVRDASNLCQCIPENHERLASGMLLRYGRSRGTCSTDICMMPRLDRHLTPMMPRCEFWESHKNWRCAGSVEAPWEMLPNVDFEMAPGRSRIMRFVFLRNWSYGSGPHLRNFELF